MKYYQLLFLLCTLLVSGCGSDPSSQQVSTFAAAEKCITCHNTSRAISSVTGAKITDEWARSTHNTMHGASCIDCHGSGNGHPSTCGGCHGGSATVGLEFHNPEKAGMCGKCHGLSHPDDVMLANAPQHFGNVTASTNNTTYRASYVSSQYVGNCRKCHNPHDPTSVMEVNRQWAESGMGDTLSGARTRYDFKTRGSYTPFNQTYQFYCVRCHTSTGFINFVTSGFSDVRPFAGPGYNVVQNIPQVQPDLPSPDKTKEVTGCNVCHDDGKGNSYGWGLRTVPPARIYYNYSAAKAVSTQTGLSVKMNNSPVSYADMGASNMCVPCHAGRGIGKMISIAAAAPYFFNFSTNAQISSHDFTGAATLLQQNGYEYPGQNYATATRLHDVIGIGNTNGTGTLGPCIACHMKSSASHSFKPVSFDQEPTADPSVSHVTSITSRTCSKCHNGATQPAWTAASLDAKRTGFQAALTLLNGLLAQKKVSGTTNWERLYGKGTGPNTMGANFNYGTLKNDWGAYAHNDIYAKRLICDSLDWLNDGVLNGDAEAAINSVTSAKNPWNSNIPYTGATLTTLKTLAINYLLGGPGGNRP